MLCFNVMQIYYIVYKFLEDDITIVTPQSIDKTESNTMFKQSKNKFKIIKQSKTLVTSSNDSDLKDQITDDETGISFEDLLDLDGMYYYCDSKSISL